MDSIADSRGGMGTSALAAAITAILYTTAPLASADVVPGTQSDVHFESSQLVGSGRDINALRLPVVDVKSGRVDYYDTRFRLSLVDGAFVMKIIGASKSPAVLGFDNIPAKVATAMLSLSHDKIVLLILINLFLLLLGLFLEPLAAMIMTMPVLLEIAKLLELDLTHLGMIVVLNLVIGLATPPVGLCLFIVCAIGRVSLEEVSRAALPMLTQELQAPMASAQLTMSALILAFGLAQLVWGPVAVRVGRRPVLPRIVDLPLGVILETLAVFQLAV